VQRLTPSQLSIPTLRVRGVDRLRVAEASIFPAMIGVNPCMTCMMIGEKCADLIRRSSWPAPGGEAL
jgi:choline oxidase